MRSFPWQVVFLLIFGFSTLSLFSIWYTKGIQSVPQNIKETAIFSIEKGEGFLTIAENLEKQGFISNKLLFIIYILSSGLYNKLQAGDYDINFLTIPEIAQKLSTGEIIKDEITIIEGWNLRDIGWYLEGKGLFQAEELFELVGFPLIDYSKVEEITQPKDFSSEFDFLRDKPKNVSLEGYLFPDTYQIAKGESLESLVRKMLSNFDAKFNSELRAEVKEQGKSIFEIVTMASILEKEVSSFEDRQIVSGILWKRLRSNIPLQADATISYITGKKTIKISKEEIKIDSPYNTYKYSGLPLGPISNPGLDSIKAAIYPKESDFWYYLSTPEGKTIFSKTLEEHNRAKAKYLK